MATLAEVVAALAPAPGRTLVAGPQAARLAQELRADAAGDGARPPEQGYDVVLCADVLGLADEPERVLAEAAGGLREGGVLLVAEPDAAEALADPALLAGERRRRFTAQTLEDAVAACGLAVTGWPSRRGLLVARAVPAADGAVAADLRRELAALQARVESVDRLQEERDALQARVEALEARDADLRERLLAAHELLAERDTEVVRLLDADRQLRQVQGTVVFRAGRRYWRAKVVARKAAAKVRRELAG